MAKGQREAFLCTVPVPRIGLGVAPGPRAGPSGQRQKQLSPGSGLSLGLPSPRGTQRSTAGLTCHRLVVLGFEN